MSQLDKIQKEYDSKKKSKGMKDAVESTEEIRRWVSIMQNASEACLYFQGIRKSSNASNLFASFAHINIGRAHLVD